MPIDLKMYQELSVAKNDIPDGWEFKTLGDVSSEISYGYTASACSDPVGPKFLRITDIQNDFVNWTKVPYCQISEDDRKKYRLDIGDICVARTGATTGVTYTVRENKDAVFASYLIRYRIDRKIADPAYVGYVLRSEIWNAHVRSIIGGSAQPGANAKQFASFKFLLPSVQEQRVIAKILSDLDEKIELNHQMNKTLELIAQTVFRDWFQKSDGVEVGCVGDLAELNRSAIDPRQHQDETFDHYSIPAFDEQKLPVAELGSTIQSNKTLVPKEAVLLSKLNPRIPRVWFPKIGAKNRAICSTEFLVATPKSGISREFLYCLFSSDEFLEKFASLVMGTSGSHQRVKPEDFLEVAVAIPEFKKISKYSDIVRPAFLKIVENLDEAGALIGLRDSLLPKLMSGALEPKI